MDELHPLVAQLQPSAEQLPAIMDRGRDVVVTAGAGAGKTRTLVARFLALLLDGLPLRKVVAITFTKKAAREMRNRVRQEMRRYLETPQLDAAERGRWQELYTALDAARIGTIHSLCGEILRHHPAEAGIDPLFEVLEEGQVALLQNQAVDEALAWAADDEQAVELFALLGEEGLRSLVQTMLKQRLDVMETLASLPADAAGLRASWQAALARKRHEATVALLANPVFQQAADMLRETGPLDPTDRIAEQRELALAAIADLLLPGSPLLDWEGGEGSPEGGPAGTGAALDQVNLTGGSGKAWPGGAEGLKEVKGALRALRDLWRAAAEWLTLDLDQLDITLADQYPGLRALFAWATARYDTRKAGLQALDFDDLEGGAVRLLREHAAVRAYWQDEVRALLVDEFQDTNHRQRDLLDLLNGAGGKLFIVGDGKQSIYRFRGADVTVFRQVWQEIARTGAAYALATSYRAHKDLIAALNALLEPVLGAAEDPLRPYVEPFARIDPYRERPAAGLEPPFVQVHLAMGRKGDALPRAAQAVVAWLVEVVEGRQVTVREIDPETGAEGARLLNYGDVAVLCRASASFAAYEDALEEAGVPFLTVAGRGFYERPEVRDVLNALRALADPADDLALAGLLRSPAGGLSDMALYRLVRGQDLPHAELLSGPDAPFPSREGGQGSRSPSLWAVLDGADLSFLGEEAPRAAAARDLVRHLHAQAGRVPVADVLKAFLDETDYRAALLRAGQSRGARNLAKLLADAHASEIVGVGAFLEYVQQLRDAGTREGEAFTIATGAVQLLTVHAAKGLEFRVVVIGDAARKSPGPRGVLVASGLGVLPPLVREEPGPAGRGKARQVKAAVYRLALQAAQDEEAAESDRLLYVAATRAQEALVISGTSRGELAGWLERLGDALQLNAGLAGVPVEGAAAPYVVEGELGGQAVRCTFYPEGVGRQVVSAGLAVGPAVELPVGLPPMLRSFAPEPVQEDELAREAVQEPPQRVWRVVPARDRPTAPAWVVGKMVHGALARWLFPAAGEDEFRAWTTAEGQSCGLTDEAEIHDAVLRAARMLRRFQATPLYAEMNAAARRLHEVPYSLLREGGIVESGVMDVLYQGPAGWTVVEFKTDDVRGRARLEKLLAEEDYVPQVARYQSAAERLLGVRPRPVLCFLDYGGEVELVEGLWG
jgi:ATP-dependent helicase/nuclease subunit A